jgi:hypothetical protein
MTYQEYRKQAKALKAEGFRQVSNTLERGNGRETRSVAGAAVSAARFEVGQKKPGGIRQ